MKITITNDGVAGEDAITIFRTNLTDGSQQNFTCIEGGQTLEIEWTEALPYRYEMVPWKRIP